MIGIEISPKGPASTGEIFEEFPAFPGGGEATLNLIGRPVDDPFEGESRVSRVRQPSSPSSSSWADRERIKYT